MSRNPNYGASRTFVDASNESSTVNVNIAPYNVISFADVLTGISQLWTAVNAITLLNPISDQITLYATKFSRVVPSDANAQRERKMLITIEDSVNFTPGRIEIPGPDFSVAPLLAGTDIFDLTDPQMAALITAIENAVYSADGNQVNVVRATAVGRNL